MNQLIVLTAFCVFLLPACTSSTSNNTNEVAGSQPNIVFILSDDHGLEDAGAYGNTTIETPNIDRLATEGVRFTRMYTTSAMCTPSRSAMYTGLYPHRNGAHQNHSTIKSNIRTIPHYLNKLGYRTGLLGKRHIKPIEQFPFEFIEDDSLKSFIVRPEPYVLFITPREPHALPGMVFEPSSKYEPEAIPIPPYLVDTEETRKQRTGYYDLVDILDHRIGEILTTLEEADQLDNTLVIYASDHGAGFPFEKWTCYEAGLNIPFIARWPGVIKQGTSTDAMVSLIDVLPTFIELAGGEAVDSLDGISFLNVITGDTRHHRDLIFGTQTTTGIKDGSYFPVRSVRNERYKYIRNLNPSGQFTNLITNRSGQGGWYSWLAIADSDTQAQERTTSYQTRPAEELYDLQNDPYELKNMASDTSLTGIKEELSNALAEWMTHVGDNEVSN